MFTIEKSNVQLQNMRKNKNSSKKHRRSKEIEDQKHMNWKTEIPIRELKLFNKTVKIYKYF